MSFTRQSRGAAFLKWFGTFLSVVLLIYLLSRQDWLEVKQALAQIQLWRFTTAFILMVISRFAVANRWHILLRAASAQISWKQSIRLTFAGLFATNFLPSTIGGDIIRLAGAVQEGLDGAVVAASLVTDRLVGMFGMVLMVPFGITPVMGWFSSNRTNSVSLQNPVYLLAVGPAIEKIWQKINIFIRKTFHTIKLWLRQPVSLLYSLLYTGIHMLCFFSIIWILLTGLNDPVPYSMVAGLYSFVYLVTLLPISINGYGLQELSISVIFSEVGGVSLQNSLTVALVFRTLTMLASLPGVFFVPGIVAGRKNNPDPQEESVIWPEDSD